MLREALNFRVYARMRLRECRRRSKPDSSLPSSRSLPYRLVNSRSSSVFTADPDIIRIEGVPEGATDDEILLVEGMPDLDDYYGHRILRYATPDSDYHDVAAITLWKD